MGLFGKTYSLCRKKFIAGFSSKIAYYFMLNYLVYLVELFGKTNYQSASQEDKLQKTTISASIKMQNNLWP